MFIPLVAIFNAQVIVESGLLCELALQNRGNVTLVLNQVGSSTCDGQEVLLVVTVQSVVEAIRDSPVLADLVLGSNVDVDLSHLSKVLVVALAIFQNPVGVACNLVYLAQVLREHEGVLHVFTICRRRSILTSPVTRQLQARTAIGIGINIVAVRADEGSLYKTQYVNRTDVLLVVALAPTIVQNIV